MRKAMMTLALAGMLALCAGPALHAQYSDSGQGNSGQQGWQGHRHGRMDPDAELQHMTKDLGLSADQQSQIRPILVDRQQKMQAVFQNQSLSREDMRSQMMSIRADSNAKIEALLTKKQTKKFEAMQEHHGHHGWQGGQGGQGGPQ